MTRDDIWPGSRRLADQAFSRAAGAELIHGNRIRLLKDAAENYPAWVSAMESAERYIYFETLFTKTKWGGALRICSLQRRGSAFVSC